MKRILVCALSLFSLCSCGYSLMDTADVHSVLGQGQKTAYIESIKHTSLYPWVPYKAQSAVHNEFSRRGILKWTAKEDADCLLKVSVNSFSLGGPIYDEGDTGMKSATVSLSVVIEDKEGKVLWESGGVSASENFQGVTEADIFDEVIAKAASEAADRMQNDF